MGKKILSLVCVLILSVSGSIQPQDSVDSMLVCPPWPASMFVPGC